MKDSVINTMLHSYFNVRDGRTIGFCRVMAPTDVEAIVPIENVVTFLRGTDGMQYISPHAIPGTQWLFAATAHQWQVLENNDEDLCALLIGLLGDAYFLRDGDTVVQCSDEEFDVTETVAQGILARILGTEEKLGILGSIASTYFPNDADRQPENKLLTAVRVHSYYRGNLLDLIHAAEAGIISLSLLLADQFDESMHGSSGLLNVHETQVMDLINAGTIEDIFFVLGAFLPYTDPSLLGDFEQVYADARSRFGTVETVNVLLNGIDNYCMDR